MLRIQSAQTWRRLWLLYRLVLDELRCRSEADRALLEVFAAVDITANGAEIEVLIGGRIDVVVCPHIVFSVIAFSDLAWMCPG